MATSKKRSGVQSLLTGSQKRVRMMLAPCSCFIFSSWAAILNSLVAGVGLAPGKSALLADLPSRELQALG